jgi:hypothetical protein
MKAAASQKQMQRASLQQQHQACQQPRPLLPQQRLSQQQRWQQLQNTAQTAPLQQQLAALTSSRNRSRKKQQMQQQIQLRSLLVPAPQQHSSTSCDEQLTNCLAQQQKARLFLQPPSLPQSTTSTAQATKQC